MVICGDLIITALFPHNYRKNVPDMRVLITAQLPNNYRNYMDKKRVKECTVKCIFFVFGMILLIEAGYNFYLFALNPIKNQINMNEFLYKVIIGCCTVGVIYLMEE